MQGKPGAWGNTSNHHSPATGHMEASTKKTDMGYSVSAVSVHVKKHRVAQEKLCIKQSTRVLYLFICFLCAKLSYFSY